MKKPVDLFMMIDRSGSMYGDPWTQETAALSNFWNDPTAEGMIVALQFFPLIGYDDAADPQCSGNPYVTPAVDWGELPSVAPALMAMMQAPTTAPNGNTPTQEALRGALMAATARQTTHPDRAVSVVIVSDGDPTSCATDALTIGIVAGQYFAATPSIRTFAIYFAPAPSDVMNAIAQQGGTTQPYLGDPSTLAGILKAIHIEAIACDFAMPSLEAGVIDPSQVVLEYVPGTGTDAGIPIPHLSGASACNPIADGWYYDDNLNPTKILLCDPTCNSIRQDPHAKINLTFGCETP